MAPVLRRALALFSPRFRPASTCEACGGAFTCGATLAGCWCQEVAVPDATRARLGASYRRCLCRACLEREAAADGHLGRGAR
jgi:hypothetical protein